MKTIMTKEQVIAYCKGTEQFDYLKIEDQNKIRSGDDDFIITFLEKRKDATNDLGKKDSITEAQLIIIKLRNKKEKMKKE